MLGNLFPNALRRKKDKQFDDILYLFLCEFGWSWEDFKNTPIPIIMRLTKKHTEISKKKNKKGKK